MDTGLGASFLAGAGFAAGFDSPPSAADGLPAAGFFPAAPEGGRGVTVPFCFELFFFFLCAKGATAMSFMVPSRGTSWPGRGVMFIPSPAGAEAAAAAYPPAVTCRPAAAASGGGGTQGTTGMFGFWALLHISAMTSRCSSVT